MPGPLRHAPQGFFLGNRKVHEIQLRRSLPQTVAVGSFQGRASQHHAARTPCQLKAKCLKPAGAVRVGQGDALLHFPDVLRRVELVPLYQRQIELLRHQAPHGRLAAASHAHHHHVNSLPCGRLRVGLLMVGHAANYRGVCPALRYRHAMAKHTDDFTRYCCELLAGLGPCIAKRMFGGFGISMGGLTFALVADLGGGEKLWLKAHGDVQQQFEAEGCKRFSYEVEKDGERKTHSLNYYSAPDEAMESPAIMQQWGRLSLDCAIKARADQKPRARPAIKKRAPVKKPQAATPPIKPRAKRPAAPATKASAARKSSKG